MAEQIMIDESNFKQMETELLGQVMNVSKAMIESFKFRLIYGVNVTEKQNVGVIKALKEFRAKNWNKCVSRNDAYKEYISTH